MLANLWNRKIRHIYTIVTLYEKVGHRMVNSMNNYLSHRKKGGKDVEETKRNKDVDIGGEHIERKKDRVGKDRGRTVRGVHVKCHNRTDRAIEYKSIQL